MLRLREPVIRCAPSSEPSCYCTTGKSQTSVRACACAFDKHRVAKTVRPRDRRRVAKTALRNFARADQLPERVPVQTGLWSVGMGGS